MKSAPLKLISGTFVEPSTGVIIYLCLEMSAQKRVMLLSNHKFVDNIDLKSGRVTR